MLSHLTHACTSFRDERGRRFGLSRIILAADTRQSLTGRWNTSAHFRDNGCKIMPLGSSAIAVSGNRDYQRTELMDPIPDWDALLDAKAAFAAHENNLHELAQDWARRSAQHYALFYKVEPARIRKLANINEQHVLVDAFIVGWQGHKPVIYWEKVFLDENPSPPIQESEQLLPYRKLPYTTNVTTQELIEGNSERTQQAATAWERKAASYSAKVRVWRWDEFVIVTTAKYDESVGQAIDVLEIPASGKTKWLQNSTCSE